MISKRSRKAELTINKLILIILAILVLLAILMFIYKVPILEWLRNLPEYKYDEDKEIEAPEAGGETGKPLIKVAVILEGGKWGGAPIYFCLDEQCTKANLIKSKLKWRGEGDSAVIEVEQRWDNQIGEVSNGKVKIYDEILEGKGTLYFEVENDLPEEKYLINLNGAEFKSGYLYRNEKVTPIERKISEDFSKKGYEIEKLAEIYPPIKDLLDGKIEETGWVKIGYRLNNQDNRLGFNTGGDDVTEMKLKKVGDKFYIKFSDSDSIFRDESPWILLKYWNEFRSFGRAPTEYILS